MTVSPAEFAERLRDYRALTEPTSVTIAPLARCPRDRLDRVLRRADRDREDHQVGIRHRLCRRCGDAVAEAKRRPHARSHRLRNRSRRRAQPTHSPSRRGRAMTPIRPRPITAMVLNSGSGHHAAAVHESRAARRAPLRSRLWCRCVMRSAFGEPVFAHAPEDDAPRVQEGVSVGRTPAVALRKMNEHEIGRARRHVEADATAARPSSAAAIHCCGSPAC